MATADLTALFNEQPYGPFHYNATKLNTALVILSWAFFGVRVFVRRKFLRHTSTDDLLMLLALVCFTVYAALVIQFLYILSSGRVLLGVNRFINSYASGVALSFWTNITLKLSLCFFFLPILTQKWARRIIIAATIVSTVSNITGCVVFLVTCGGPGQAIAFLFTDNCSGSPKMNTKAFVRAGVYFPTYTNIAIDVIFSLIPIPMLLQTTLDRKQKLSVSIYLALSTLGSVCAIGKIFYTNPRKNGGLEPYVKTAQNFAAFNTAELAAYIIGGSVAAYRPMLMAIGRRISGTTNMTGRTRADPTGLSSFGQTRTQQSGMTVPIMFDIREEYEFQYGRQMCGADDGVEATYAELDHPKSESKDVAINVTPVLDTKMKNSEKGPQQVQFDAVSKDSEKEQPMGRKIKGQGTLRHDKNDVG